MRRIAVVCGERLSYAVFWPIMRRYESMLRFA